jgi:hypothetical protein
MALIDITGVERAELLATLYNGAQPFGFGKNQFDPRDMTVAEAQTLLDNGQTEFDYLKGRLMKVKFTGDALLDDWGYDKTYGIDVVQRVVDNLRASNRPITAMRPIKLKTPGI